MSQANPSRPPARPLHRGTLCPVRTFLTYLSLCTIALTSACQSVDGSTDDPRPGQAAPSPWAQRADSTRVLENPHKGWFHHFYDDAGTRYGERNAGDLAAVPGLDHLYLRLAWSQLEPREGQYDWALIDEVVAEYTPQGLGVAFAFTCKETAVEYATPRWVRDAGARGTELVGRVPWDASLRVWEPDYGDPVFLAKLGNFHRAVAARYADAPWLRYVQIASYGTWGEGHNWPATDSVYALAAQTAHIDLYRAAYPDDVLLTITDDWYGNVSDAAFRQNIRAYVESRGITYTDHSPLVKFYVDNFAATASIRSPELFDAVYRDRPIPIELEHYGNVVNDGTWGAGGQALVRRIIGVTHATYLGYHGYADEYVRDNPVFTSEIANRVGYWLFVEDAGVAVDGRTVRADVRWRNRGSAPVYHDYALQLRLEGPVSRTLTFGPSGLLGIDAEEGRSLVNSRELPADIVAGEYKAYLRLQDEGGTGRVVDVALAEEGFDADGFWFVAEVDVK